MRNQLLLLLISLVLLPAFTKACSVLYYIDKKTGTVYVVNNEDYWYDVKAFIKIEPRKNNKQARLWYGWDRFAQGGVNESGLFFDAAVTPEQPEIKGYGNPKSNLGDDILANCKTVEEALSYLEQRKIGLTKSHMMFGDKTGRAVVVEWVNGEKKLNWITDNKLIMTNYLLTDTTAGNYPCYRYQSIENKIKQLEEKQESINMLTVGNTFSQAAQAPKAVENDRIGGTVYTTFINLTEMKLFLSYKLSNSNVTKLDLKEVFNQNKKQKINLGN